MTLQSLASRVYSILYTNHDQASQKRLTHSNSRFLGSTLWDERVYTCIQVEKNH